MTCAVFTVVPRCLMDQYVVFGFSYGQLSWSCILIGHLAASLRYLLVLYAIARTGNASPMRFIRDPLLSLMDVQAY